MKRLKRSRAVCHARQICVVLTALFVLALRSPDAGAGSPSVPKINDKGIKALLTENKGKVVLLNFWATWCPPCVEEIPGLVKIHNKYKSKGLQVIGVSMNDSAEMNELQAFLRKNKPSYPIYIAASKSDSFLKSIDKRWSGDIPLTLIYDRSGKLRYFRKEDRKYAQFEKDLKPLLAASH